MRLLLDQNLSFKLCDRLSDLYPGSTQARLLGLDQADDRTLWERAKAEGFLLVTQDADFAEMAALYGPPPKVVWLRGGNRSTAAVEGTLRRNYVLIRSFFDKDETTYLELHERRGARDGGR